MDMNLISAITAVASALAAALAWIAKLRWSREFAAAKDATIDAKEAQINQLRQEVEAEREHAKRVADLKDEAVRSLRDQLENERAMNPSTVRQYTLAIRDQLEDAVKQAEARAQETSRLLEERETQIRELQSSRQPASALSHLLDEKGDLERAVAALSGLRDSLRAKLDEAEELAMNFIGAPDAELIEAYFDAALGVAHNVVDPARAENPETHARFVKALRTLRERLAPVASAWRQAATKE